LLIKLYLKPDAQGVFEPIRPDLSAASAQKGLLKGWANNCLYLLARHTGVNVLEVFLVEHLLPLPQDIRAVKVDHVGMKAIGPSCIDETSTVL